MRWVSFALYMTSWMVLVACSQQPGVPAPPSTGSSPDQTVTINDRVAWDQAAADTVELGSFHYAIFVDGTRSELTDVSCGNTPASGSFTCSSRLPSMSAGRHQLELATFIIDGPSILESSKSAAVQITFVGALAPASQARASTTTERSAPAGTADTAAARERATATLPLVAEGLDQISDITFAPDGRLFIAQKTGRIRVMRDGALLPRAALDASNEPESRTTEPIDGAGAVLALAFDPQFDRSHFVYVLSTAGSRRGTLSFVLARYREYADTLAERVVLLDNVAASPSNPKAALRFGPDGKLYVAFDAGGDARAPGDLASPNGKVLRLNADGTTPADQAAASPLYSSAYQSPRGLGWDAESGIMWIVDAAGAGVAQLNAVAAGSTAAGKRGITKATVALPPLDEPSALLFVRDSVLIASVRGEPLVRGRIDMNDRTRIMQTDSLIHGISGGVQAMTVGPDGALYVATAGAIGRVSLQ